VEQAPLSGVDRSSKLVEETERAPGASLKQSDHLIFLHKTISLLSLEEVSDALVSRASAVGTAFIRIPSKFCRRDAFPFFKFIVIHIRLFIEMCVKKKRWFVG
jgi:hypothetical protein